MRSLLIIAIWFGLGYGLTDLVARNVEPPLADAQLGHLNSAPPSIVDAVLAGMRHKN